MLRETCQVLESAENSLYSHPFPVGSYELLRSMTTKFPINSKDASDARASRLVKLLYHIFHVFGCLSVQN